MVPRVFTIRIRVATTLTKNNFVVDFMYSRVHISPDEVFSMPLRIGKALKMTFV